MSFDISTTIICDHCAARGPSALGENTLRAVVAERATRQGWKRVPPPSRIDLAEHYCKACVPVVFPEEVTR